MYKKILIPTDGSALSERAAAAAIALARGSGAVIVAMSVAEPDSWQPADERDTAGAAEEAQRIRHAAEKHARRVARLADDAGVPCQVVTVAAPQPHQAIIAQAIELDCDLIFIAAHGQGAHGRLIAGSVPQKVLAYAPVPVILFRGNTEPA